MMSPLYDHALDTAVSHATADKDYIMRHMDYQRTEACIQINDVMHPIETHPRFHILDPRRHADIQGANASQKVLSMHIDEESRIIAVKNQILNAHPETRQQHT